MRALYKQINGSQNMENTSNKQVSLVFSPIKNTVQIKDEVNYNVGAASIEQVLIFHQSTQPISSSSAINICLLYAIAASRANGEKKRLCNTTPVEELVNQLSQLAFSVTSSKEIKITDHAEKATTHPLSEMWKYIVNYSTSKWQKSLLKYLATTLSTSKKPLTSEPRITAWWKDAVNQGSPIIFGFICNDSPVTLSLFFVSFSSKPNSQIMSKADSLIDIRNVELALNTIEYKAIENELNDKLGGHVAKDITKFDFSLSPNDFKV